MKSRSPLIFIALFALFIFGGLESSAQRRSDPRGERNVSTSRSRTRSQPRTTSRSTPQPRQRATPQRSSTSSRSRATRAAPTRSTSRARSTRSAPTRSVQTPPSRSRTVQTPPTRGTSRSGRTTRSQPSSRTQTPPRAQPRSRTQTPPRAQPTTRTRTRTQTPPTRSTNTSRSRTRTPQPTTRPSTRSTGRSRTTTAPTTRTPTTRTPTRSTRSQPTTTPNSRYGTSRTTRRNSSAGTNRSGRTTDTSRSRVERLKRYTDSNRNSGRASSGTSATERSSRLRRVQPNSPSAIGGSNRSGASTSRSGSSVRTPSTRQTGRNGRTRSTVNTDRSGSSPLATSEASGRRSGTSTVRPTPTRRGRTARRSEVAGESRVDSIPRLGSSRRASAGEGSRGRRLEPFERADSGGRESRDGRDGRRGGDRHRGVEAGYFRGSRNWGFNRRSSGHRHYRSGSSFNLFFGFGGGYDYGSSYLFGASYGPYWDYWRYGIRTPGHLGYASPAHVHFGVSTGFRRHARFHFGFSSYHPCSSWSPYPFYRTRYWTPWYVDHWAALYPAYRTYYAVEEPVYIERPVYVVETADPYVDEEVILPADDIDAVGFDGAPAGEVEYVDGIPVAFQRSLLDEVPDGLSYDEYLAWGEEALYAADYLSASEAFRRAARLRWDDDYPKFQLAVALFGAERYDLAYLALELGLDQNPAWLYRRFDLRDTFASEEEFAARVGALERYLIRNEGNDEARFVLGYVYYFSGNLFGARSVVRVLSDSGARFRHLDALARESERRLTGEGR